MELQFHKTVLSCLQRVKQEVQNQEQTQEVRISDGMPDIGHVLGAWGQVLMRGKEWRSSGMSVSGGVMVWILYAPEDGGQPQSVETWIPFQMKWDFPESQADGTIRAACLLRSVDARSASARKLIVRTNVGIQAEANVPGEAVFYSPGELPEDVQVLKNTYPVQLPREAGEKSFAIEEELTVPGTEPGMDKLIRCSLQPELVDRKVMADKVVFRGAAILHVLYRDKNGSFNSCDFELPFSQYSELNKEYDQDAVAWITPAVTSLELDVDPEGKLLLKAGLTGQYVICDRPMIEVVEDAYSPDRKVSPKLETLNLPAILEEQTQTVRAEQTVDADGVKPVDVAFWPDHARTLHNGDAVEMVLPGQFQLLYADAEGNLYSAVSRWEDTWDLHADENAQMTATVWPTGKPQAAFGAGKAEMRADVVVDALTTARQGMAMVSALELGEAMERDEARPSLIVCRVGEDSLWNVAKRTGSTVEAIRSANNLTDEPSADRLLLIPVP